MHQKFVTRCIGWVPTWGIYELRAVWMTDFRYKMVCKRWAWVIALVQKYSERQEHSNVHHLIFQNLISFPETSVLHILERHEAYCHITKNTSKFNENNSFLSDCIFLWHVIMQTTFSKQSLLQNSLIKRFPHGLLVIHVKKLAGGSSPYHRRFHWWLLDPTCSAILADLPVQHSLPPFLPAAPSTPDSIYYHRSCRRSIGIQCKRVISKSPCF